MNPRHEIKPSFLYRSDHAYPYNSPSSLRQVNYDIEEMNNNVIINGGIFVCTYEGLYHFNANIYGTYEEISPDNDYIGLHILVNGKNAAYNRSFGASVVTVSHLVKLKLGDLVSVSKVWRTTIASR